MAHAPCPRFTTRSARRVLSRNASLSLVCVLRSTPRSPGNMPPGSPSRRPGPIAAGSSTTTEKVVIYTLFAPADEAVALARQPGCPHAQSFFVWVARVLCCLQWSEQCSSVLLDGTSQRQPSCLQFLDMMYTSFGSGAFSKSRAAVHDCIESRWDPVRAFDSPRTKEAAFVVEPASSSHSISQPRLPASSLHRSGWAVAGINRGGRPG